MVKKKMGPVVGMRIHTVGLPMAAKAGRKHWDRKIRGALFGVDDFWSRTTVAGNG